MRLKQKIETIFFIWSTESIEEIDYRQFMISVSKKAGLGHFITVAQRRSKLS